MRERFRIQVPAGIGGLLPSSRPRQPSTAADVHFWFLYDANGNVGLLSVTRPGQPAVDPGRPTRVRPLGNTLTVPTRSSATPATPSAYPPMFDTTPASLLGFSYYSPWSA